MNHRHLLYPVNWTAIATEIKQLNDWCCLACGRKCRRPGQFYLGWEFELTCAHITQDYEADAVYVAPLCAACHLAWDSRFVWWARRRADRLRRRQAGQLLLLTE